MTASGRPATHTINADARYRFDFKYNALGLLDVLTYPSAGAGDAILDQRTTTAPAA